MAQTSQTKVHYSHRLNDSLKEKIAGAFVLLALIIFFGLFAMNSQQLHLFDDYVEYQLMVDSAEGLDRDTPVRVSGMQVGRVDQVMMNDDHELEVTLRVYDQYVDLIRTDSRVFLGRQTLLGRGMIDISVGDPNNPQVEPGSMLPTEESPSIEELTAMMVPVVENVDASLARVADILAAIEPDQVATMVANVEQVTTDIAAITSGLEAGEGMAGKLLRDEDLAAELTKAVTTVNQVLAGVDQQIRDLTPTLAAVEQTTAAASEQLPEVLRQTEGLLEGLNYTVTAVNTEVAELPQLISQTQVLMRQTEQLLEQVNNMWLFSGDDAEVPPRLIEVTPYD